MKQFKNKILIIIIGLFFLSILSMYTYEKAKTESGIFILPTISFFLILYFCLHLRNKEESDLKIKNIVLEYLFKIIFLLNGIFIGLVAIFLIFSFFKSKAYFQIILTIPLIYYSNILMWLPSDYNDILKSQRES